MLLLAGILLTLIGLGTAVLLAFAQGMSDAPEDKGLSNLWPAGIALLLAIACFVARHFLHGQSITW